MNGHARRRVLLVDDDKAWALDYATLLSGAAAIDIAWDEASAIESMRGTVHDAVLLDLRFGGQDLGLIILERMLEIDPTLPVILLTGNDSARAAVAALRRGAFDYLVKGTPLDEVESCLRRAFEHRDLRRELVQVRERLNQLEGDWIGSGDGIDPVLQAAQTVAPADVTVLILGETGTGKGTLARMIHRASGRGGEAVFVHGARSSEELFESELYGYLKGSHSRAERDTPGLIAAAGRGTLVFDDADCLPAAMQAKLLDLLEERTYRPVGGTKLQTCEARFIATARPNLEEIRDAGAFREDLYYRLCGYEIRIPPLREQPESILPLAMHFLARASEECKKTINGMTADARRWILTYPWPGNVRELRSAVSSAVLHCPGRELDVRHFPHRGPRFAGAQGATGAAAPGDRKTQRRMLEREYVERLLKVTGGNVSEAARLAGMSRTGFQRLRNRLLGPPDATPRG